MTELRDELQGTLGAAYSLERELGGGGMSRVFVATDAALGRRVVVKVLPPEVAGGVSVERFRREIHVLSTLVHPHIVPLLSAGEMSGVPYYTMPFVDGETLRDRLRGTGALPLADVVRILCDVASALAYAHAQGVVHRDVKPDNVLLSAAGAMMTDFGIAKAISSSATAAGRTSLTMSGMTVGTPEYMAPEQAAANPVDHRADIYSFGCMAYELLTGQPPFADVPPYKRLLVQAQRAPAPVSDFRPDVPRPLELLLARCLRRDPAKRPQRTEELSEVLTSVVARRSALIAMPTALLVPVVLGKVLMMYLAAVLGVLLLARGATVWLGLPAQASAWAMIAMALALPFVLWITWKHYRDRRAASEAPIG